MDFACQRCRVVAATGGVRLFKYTFFKFAVFRLAVLQSSLRWAKPHAQWLHVPL